MKVAFLFPRRGIWANGKRAFDGKRRVKIDMAKSGFSVTEIRFFVCEKSQNTMTGHFFPQKALQSVDEYAILKKVEFVDCDNAFAKERTKLDKKSPKKAKGDAFELVCCSMP